MSRDVVVTVCSSCYLPAFNVDESFLWIDKERFIVVMERFSFIFGMEVVMTFC